MSSKKKVEDNLGKDINEIEVVAPLTFGKDEVSEDEVTFDENVKSTSPGTDDPILDTKNNISEEEFKEAELLAAEKNAELNESSEKVKVKDNELETVEAKVSLDPATRASIDHLISRFKDRSQGKGRIIQPARGGKYVNTATKEQWI